MVFNIFFRSRSICRQFIVVVEKSQQVDKPFLKMNFRC